MIRRAKTFAICIAALLAFSAQQARADDPCEPFRLALDAAIEMNEDCHLYGDCDRIEILLNEINCNIDECENTPGGYCAAAN
jgi:hypothetical protein